MYYLYLYCMYCAIYLYYPPGPFPPDSDSARVWAPESLWGRAPGAQSQRPVPSRHRGEIPKIPYPKIPLTPAVFGTNTAKIPQKYRKIPQKIPLETAVFGINTVVFLRYFPSMPPAHPNEQWLHPSAAPLRCQSTGTSTTTTSIRHPRQSPLPVSDVS